LNFTNICGKVIVGAQCDNKINGGAHCDYDLNVEYNVTIVDVIFLNVKPLNISVHCEFYVVHQDLE